MQKTTLFALLLMFRTAAQAQVLGGPSYSDVYVYNDGKDSIKLSPISGREGDGAHCGKIVVVDSVQIDGKGAKEIVFRRSCFSIMSLHGGTFDITEFTSLSKYEIWNLDKKQMLFEATDSLRSQFDRFYVGVGTGRTAGNISYGYKFSIDSSGQITISQLGTYADVYTFTREKINRKKDEYKMVKTRTNYQVTPDKAEGRYLFADGKYELQ